jgi:hypothetical protein
VTPLHWLYLYLGLAVVLLTATGVLAARQYRIDIELARVSGRREAYQRGHAAGFRDGMTLGRNLGQAEGDTLTGLTELMPIWRHQ